MCILLLAQNSPNTRAEWIDQRFFFQVLINASLRIYLRYCKYLKLGSLLNKNDTLEENENISARRREILQAFA